MRRMTMTLLAFTIVTAATAEAAAATRKQFGAKCAAAWTGKRGTAAFRTYKKKCVAASIAATKAARAAGDNDDAKANGRRAATACRAQFPAPRTTKLARARFKACVRAAVASQKAYGGRPLHATLAGDASTDADGMGTATLTLNQGQKQICFDVSWTNIGVVSGLHIHLAADNSIVIGLDGDADLTDGNARSCLEGIAPATVKAIRQHPEDYYVNVHTDEFPSGAIRGTLSA